ncbi:MAG TPA: hypothetical protein DIC56_03035, partial [Rhizobium sp.]|nr:hypothetical protein [Rhizobium sp.]
MEASISSSPDPGRAAAGARGTALVAGLGLGLAGFVAILAQLALSGQSFADLPLASLLTAERLLPLFGLGLLFGQLRRRSLAISLVLLVAGAAAGIVWREAFFWQMAAVPGAG